MYASRTTLLGVTVLAAVCLISARPAAAQHVYDASADFSTTSNPDPLDGGVWSYGQEATLGGPFALYTTTGSSSNGQLQGWTTSTGSPDLADNTSGSVFSENLNGATITIQPNQLNLDPGPQGQYSVLRFTAPTTSTYSFSGNFNAADSRPTTTDVHVLLNGTAIANGGINVNGGGNTATLASNSLALTKGQTLDFVVGFGNNDYSYDTTGLYADVTNLSAPVPEASTTVSFGLLLTLGLGSMVLARKKRVAASL